MMRYHCLSCFALSIKKLNKEFQNVGKKHPSNNTWYKKVGLQSSTQLSHFFQQPVRRSCCVCVCVCVRTRVLNHVWLCVIPWPTACQAPLSTKFSRQEYWSGLSFPSPGDYPNSEIKPVSLMSPALACIFFTTVPPGKPHKCYEVHIRFISHFQRSFSPSLFISSSDIYGFTNSNHYLIVVGFLSPSSDTFSYRYIGSTLPHKQM